MSHQLLIEIKDVTEKVHGEVSNSVAAIDKACHRGCSACCHQIVDVFTWEEPRIIEFISSKLNNKKKKLIAKNLKKWFKLFNKKTRPADRSNPLSFQEVRDVQHIFREEKIACPFLLGMECSIYEVRPLVCKTHYAVGSSEQCKTNPHLITPKKGQDILIDAGKSFKPEIYPVAMKPLPYLVAPEFDESITSKPMLGIIFDPNFMFDR